MTTQELMQLSKEELVRMLAEKEAQASAPGLDLEVFVNDQGTQYPMVTFWVGRKAHRMNGTVIRRVLGEDRKIMEELFCKEDGGVFKETLSKLAPLSQDNYAKVPRRGIEKLMRSETLLKSDVSVKPRRGNGNGNGNGAFGG
jgi:hypothetical protein